MPRTKTSARRAITETREVKDGDRRIRFTGSTENPRRAGTVQYERFEVLRRYSGKKVEAFLAAKGADRTALKRAQNEKLVTLK